MSRRKGWMGSHPLDGACTVCDLPLGGGTQRTNPLVQTRQGWAHRDCILRERGE